MKHKRILDKVKKIITIIFLLFSLTCISQTYNMSNTPVTTCSGTFYDSQGTSNYLSNEDYTKVFTPSIIGNVLQFNFTTFNCESVTYDKLKIYDGPTIGSPLIGTYGGTTGPGIVTATNATGQLTFVWHSDGSVTRPGWIASISCVAPPVPTCFDGIMNQDETGIDCGGTICIACGLNHNIGTGNLNACTGSLFDTGGSGGNYSSSETIVETYCSNAGNCIRITFNSFNTESGYDKLTIYDGPTTGSPLIGVYDGTVNPGTIISSAGCLTFSWVSDGSVTRPGWDATITCVACPVPTCFDGIQNQGETGIDCGGPCPACPPIIIPTSCTNTTYNLTTLSSVSFYDDGGIGGDPCASGAINNYCNCNCFTTVTICAAPGEYIIADFREFSMFNTNSGFDWMVIYDNNTTSGTILFDNRAIGSTNGNPPLFTTNATVVGIDNPLGDCNFTMGMMNYCSTGNCLTFQFWATSVVNRAGWDALVTSVAASCVLPIELKEFKGHNEENINYLTWTTLSEINNDYFKLERSRDGKNWERIGIVFGSGNSNVELKYDFIDDSYINGVNYYRLNQIDFDGGKSETFNIISINTEIIVYEKWKYIINLTGQLVNDDYTGFRLLVYDDGRVLPLTSTQKNPKVRK